MSGKSKNKSEAPKARTLLDGDETVRAFQFVRAWATRTGEPVLNKSGNQVHTASAMHRGGGFNHESIDIEDYTEDQIKRGLALLEINEGIGRDEVTPFINGKVIVYRTNPKPKPYGRQSLAVA